jgi:hypothetical protein
MHHKKERAIALLAANGFIVSQSLPTLIPRFVDFAPGLRIPALYPLVAALAVFGLAAAYLALALASDQTRNRWFLGSQIVASLPVVILTAAFVLWPAVQAFANVSRGTYDVYEPSIPKPPIT